LVTGPRAATSDYEPAPDGFPGFAVPVEKIYPCLVPFLELADGRTIAAADGADDILPSGDGQRVVAIWRHWVVVGGKAGELEDPGLTSEVTWTFEGNTLRRTESLTSSKIINVRRLWLAIPSRYDHLETSYQKDARIDRLVAEGKTLEVQVKEASWPFKISAFATGDDPLGRGDRGPIPIHVILQTPSFVMTSATRQHWELSLTTN
jgi:hypothetical protein